MQAPSHVRTKRGIGNESCLLRPCSPDPRALKHSAQYEPLPNLSLKVQRVGLSVRILCTAQPEHVRVKFSRMARFGTSWVETTSHTHRSFLYCFPRENSRDIIVKILKYGARAPVHSRSAWVRVDCRVSCEARWFSCWSSVRSVPDDDETTRPAFLAEIP
jgi:hypothetical protein